MFHGDFSEEEIDIVSIFYGVKKVWFWKEIENKPLIKDDSITVRPQLPALLHNYTWSTIVRSPDMGVFKLQEPESFKSANGLQKKKKKGLQGTELQQRSLFEQIYSLTYLTREENLILRIFKKTLDFQNLMSKMTL